jgi:hypothetical protein
MAFANSLEEYQTIQKHRIAKMRTWKRKGPISAAKFMALNMRSMAPRKSGDLIRSIKRSKNKVRASGVNRRTGWPYLHWINETKEFNLRSDGKRYSQVRNRTGTPRFYTISRNRTRKYFRDSALKATRKALTSKF